MDPVLFIGIFWGLPISAGHLVGSWRGKRAGWAWGLFLSWLGVLILALLPNDTPQHVAMTEIQTQVTGMDADVQALEVRGREAS